MSLARPRRRRFSGAGFTVAGSLAAVFGGMAIGLAILAIIYYVLAWRGRREDDRVTAHGYAIGATVLGALCLAAVLL